VTYSASYGIQKGGSCYPWQSIADWNRVSRIAT